MIEANMDLRRRYNFGAAEVQDVRYDIFDAQKLLRRGGSFGSKDHLWH